MLSLNKVGFETSQRSLFSDVDLSVNKGDKIGLVGHNGVGKTTLLGIMSGDVDPTRGEVNAGNYEVGLMPQDLKEWLDKSVYEFIEYATGVADAKKAFEESCSQLEQKTDDTTLLIYSDSLEKYTRLDAASFENNLEKALSIADLNGIDTTKSLGDFSGGQRTRIAMAATFASRHDVILLDEPTNNLDSNGITVLEKFINNSNAAFVIVSHDRSFLRTATTRIVELLGNGGSVKEYGMGYDEFVESRRNDLEATQKRYEQYESEKKRIRKAAKEATIKSNSAASSRSKSADNDKLNTNFRKEKAASGLARAAQGLQTRATQLDEPDRPIEEVSLNFMFQEGTRKKHTLITVNDLAVKYDNDFTAGPISLHVQNGDRVVLDGKNGIGKSSLLRALIGNTEGSVNGRVSIGNEVSIVSIDQNQTVPFMEKTAFDNLRFLHPELAVHDAINLLIRFNINKDVIRTVKAKDLSGGERAKILLAHAAASNANLLILDEPTNNLDIETIEALENALSTYSGGIIAVSHDRAFLEKLNPTEVLDLNQQ